MVSPELEDGGRVSLVDGAEQILGLMLQLIEVRANGQTTTGHDEFAGRPARLGTSVS